METPAILLAAALAAGLLHGAPKPVDLIDAAKPTSGWGFGTGMEFPGAKGALEAAPDAEVEAARRPALKVAADFTGGGMYVQAGRGFKDGVEAESLSLWFKAPKGASGFTLRLVDATGQCHQIPIRVASDGGWRQIEFPIVDYFAKAGSSAAIDWVGRYENWGGANDGQWHQPAKEVSLLVGRHETGDAKKGEFLFSAVRLHPGAPKGEVVQEVRLDEAIDDGDADWGLNLGWEFKGAKGEIACAQDGGANVTRLAGDFTEGGVYIAAEKDLDRLDLTALRLRVKTANASGFTCRLVDATGQCHQTGRLPLQADGAWHEVELPVSRVAGGQHWGGANDGRWHAPARHVALVLEGSSAADRKPALLLKDVVAVARRRVAVAGAPHAETFGGAGRLDLSRSEDDMLANRAGEWTGAPFAAAEGPWNVSASFASALHSPDDSFCVRLAVECLDAGGGAIDSFTVASAYGKRAWTVASGEFEFPAGTAQARFAARYFKTHGTVSFRDAAATPLARTGGEKIVDRILIDGRKTVDGEKKTNGHLFLPSDTMDFEIAVLARATIPSAGRAARVTVRDYWGAEILPAAEVPLAAAGRAEGRVRYVGKYTVPKDAVPVGKYHELHVDVAPKGYAAAAEYSGFARLPVAASKKYAPKDIPFQIRNWDSRIREYFELADRIGHRTIGLWGDSGWEFVEAMGDDWYTGDFAGEVERNGWKNTTPEKVYKATFDLVAKHRNHRLRFVCLGNEPNEKPEKVQEKVDAYEQVYKAAHAANPDITVVGTSVWAQDNFFNAGYGKWCDVYDYHVYESYADARRGVRGYREYGKRFGLEKPVWCTEIGLMSQGQTRYTVACEVVKKIVSFFAEGGESVGWFTILYPDKDGKSRAAGGDCHSMFDCKYNLYNPRLDAIMNYAMINQIAVKKFSREAQYPDGTQAYLFRDAAGESLLALWREGGRAARGIPLSGVKEAALTRVDGSTARLAPAGGVLTLGLSPEPVLLRFRGGAAKLPPRLAPAAFDAEGAEKLDIARGGARTVTLAGKGLRAGDLAALVPPRWKATFAQKGADRVALTVTAPAETAARAGRVTVQKRLREGIPAEITLTLPVK